MYASVIIPFYNGDNHRERNLRAVIRSALASLESNSELIVVEQVTKTNLSEFASDHRFIHYCQPVSKWNKSEAWNQGFKLSRGKAIIGLDADIIVNESVFTQSSVEEFTKKKLTYPFVDIVDLTISETTAYCESSSFLKHIDVAEQANRLRNGRRCYGGIWIMPRSAFVDIGGYDRSFEIWGGEDDIFHWITTALFTREQVCRTNGVAYHLWHPVSNTKDYLESENYKRIVELKQHIMGKYYDTTTAPKYCKIQRYLNGLVGYENPMVR
jgi:glycosyltransferase involved in cell wall biosynthesis